MNKLNISYENCIDYIVAEKQKGVGSRVIAKEIGVCKSTVNYWYLRYTESKDIKHISPKVLVLDIETNPVVGY